MAPITTGLLKTRKCDRNHLSVREWSAETHWPGSNFSVVAVVGLENWYRDWPWLNLYLKFLCNMCLSRLFICLNRNRYRNITFPHITIPRAVTVENNTVVLGSVISQRGTLITVLVTASSLSVDLFVLL